MTEYTFTVVFEEDEDGRVVALCPALQGCHADGATQEEAILNIREAIQAHIASRLKHGEPITKELGTQQIAVAL